MGTRNLTIVVSNGEYKLAQYAQWDGYPTGQGSEICDFIQNKMDKAKFKKAIDSLKEIKPKELKALWVKFGAKEDSDLVSFEVADKFKAAMPEFSRDTGSKILGLIQDGKVKQVNNDLEFAGDSLFCEFAYVLDLDNDILEVYKGFNKTPLTKKDRFNFIRPKKDEYKPVKLVKKYPFKKATSKAMFDLDKELNKEDEE